MMFPDRKAVERLRKKFPAGCRVVLDFMDDVQAPPVGTQGTCRGVDDAGSVMVSWDSGGSLSVAYGADCCHPAVSEVEIQKSLEHLGKIRHRGTSCPRCGCRVDGEYRHQLQAVSRRADIQICNDCGTKEALEDFTGKRMPLAEWAIVKAGWVE